MSHPRPGPRPQPLYKLPMLGSRSCPPLKVNGNFRTGLFPVVLDRERSGPLKSQNGPLTKRLELQGPKQRPNQQPGFPQHRQPNSDNPPSPTRELTRCHSQHLPKPLQTLSSAVFDVRGQQNAPRAYLGQKENHNKSPPHSIVGPEQGRWN